MPNSHLRRIDVLHPQDAAPLLKDALLQGILKGLADSGAPLFRVVEVTNPNETPEFVHPDPALVAQARAIWLDKTPAQREAIEQETQRRVDYVRGVHAQRIAAGLPEPTGWLWGRTPQPVYGGRVLPDFNFFKVPPEGIDG